MLQFIMHVTYLTWFMHALCMSSSTYKQQSKVSYQMLEKLFRTSRTLAGVHLIICACKCASTPA